MKRKGLLALAIGLLTFVACDKDEEIIDNSIEGIYIGTLTFGNDLKSASNMENEGTAVVTKNGVDEIQVHCFGSGLDTTFMLNLYEHHDSILVCLTGENFQHMYGHQLGGNGHMMGHSNGGETSWRHHLNDEHHEGDEHFGGFHMGSHTFNYLIKMENGYYHFEGQK